jgi:hypothetical protein
VNNKNLSKQTKQNKILKIFFCRSALEAPIARLESLDELEGSQEIYVIYFP